jgi:hypothetical protein
LKARQKIVVSAEFFSHENIIGMVSMIKPESPVGYKDIYLVTDPMETDLHRVIYSRQVPFIARHLLTF